MPFNEEAQDWVVNDIPAKLIKELEILKEKAKNTLLDLQPDNVIAICKYQTRYRVYCEFIEGIQGMLENKNKKEGEN